MGKYIAKQPNKNGHIDFTAEENETWKILINRQMDVIQNRACDGFIEGLKKLDLPRDRVPQCTEVSEVLQASTGWSVVPVAALIPLKTFFELLANRKFPAASFIRIREELDYLQEPDIFHELFGHCPMLTNQAYADFVQWYGESALKTTKEVQSILGRLFWFTIEFGLLQSPQGLRVYGGGILSSYAETLYALEDNTPERLPFDLIQILNTQYRYDIIQDRYFIINDLSALFQLKTNTIIEIATEIATGTYDGDDFIIC
jgi:phenylalanine-4-hydroxylase